MWTSWARTGLSWYRGSENKQCTFCTYFCYCAFYNRIIRQKRHEQPKRSECERDPSFLSPRGVTWVAKSLRQSPSPCSTWLLFLWLQCPPPPPRKAPSYGLVIWTVSWHVGTMDPKPYKLGKAPVSRFLSSDPARSILLIHINSAKSAKAEWQLLHEEERELRPNTFLTLLEDQVAPSSKWRLPGLLSTGTVVFTTIFQKLRYYFRVKIIEIIKVLI